MNLPASLADMDEGREGVVAEVRGGRGLARRLEALGIRPGVVVTKLSGPYMRGPVTVKVGRARVALGFGMATKVVIDPAQPAGPVAGPAPPTDETGGAE